MSASVSRGAARSRARGRRRAPTGEQQIRRPARTTPPASSAAAPRSRCRTRTSTCRLDCARRSRARCRDRDSTPGRRRPSCRRSRLDLPLPRTRRALRRHQHPLAPQRVEAPVGMPRELESITGASRARGARPRRPRARCPRQVDVDAERPRVDRVVAHDAVADEQHAHRREHQPDRNADVELHQKNTRFSAAVAASTMPPRTAGRWYHGSCASRRLVGERVHEADQLARRAAAWSPG